MEDAVWTGMARSLKGYDMIWWNTRMQGIPWRLSEYNSVVGTLDNLSLFSDKKVDDVYLSIREVVGKDDNKVSQLIHDITPYLIEQSIAVMVPSPYAYNMWWPWVKCYPKGYHGEHSIGMATRGTESRYIWIDQELKKSMGY